MRKFCFVLVVVSSGLAFAARAQVTNIPPTRLEAFEQQTGTVIVKGAGDIGSLGVGVANITVISKESTDISTGRKEYGIAVEADANNQRVWKKVLDYDEIDGLLGGLNYLAKVDYNATSLPTFVAGYSTKSGLRVGAFTSQRRGAIQFFLHDYTTNGDRILITPTQLAQFENLIEQAKKSQDALRAAK